MIRIVTIGGTGDAYLICALSAAVKRHHHQPVEITMRAKFACIGAMFPGVTVRQDDIMVSDAENNKEMQRSYRNELLSGRPYYAHPCFLNSGIRIDQMTIKPDTSQADMYRMILHLPHDAPMVVPNIPSVANRDIRSVLMIKEAGSWPTMGHDQFWIDLEGALRSSGHVVTMNDKRWSLGELFDHCRQSEWVIAPQCGVMSILCTARFPCRKTLATPSVDDFHPDGFLPKKTFPYGYATKFAGEDYDIEEFKITKDNHAEIIHSIMTGANAQRLWPHDPRPVITLYAPLTPGDALDRLAVLTVKRDRFSAARRAVVEREYQRYAELVRETLKGAPSLARIFSQMIANHQAAYDVLERMVPTAAGNGEINPVDHVEAILLNRGRIDLKRKVDVECRAPYTEQKSYYDPPAVIAVISDKEPDAAVVMNGNAVPKLLDSVNGINLVSYHGKVYTVPQHLGPIDLTTIDLSSHPVIRVYSRTPQ